MTNKDLTIVITTYKSEKKIEKCINSISSKYKIIIQTKQRFCKKKNTNIFIKFIVTKSNVFVLVLL